MPHSYAENVMSLLKVPKLDYACPAPSRKLSKARKPSNINNISSNFKISLLNAQSATNKIDELAMLCDDLKPEILLVSEHGFLRLYKSL